MSIVVHAPFSPKGDQPRAIKQITKSFESGNKHHTLLGVTGSGKTFTMANIIAKLNQSALIIAPNKTLAAQLFSEFREFFPENSVNFFISYYDYYQPEAYVPSTDTFIEKDSSINSDIDKMRHQSTQNLFEKKHAIIISSVSCIYGLGSPDVYSKNALNLNVGMCLDRQKLCEHLISLRYERNNIELNRGRFRVNGEVFDIIPPTEKSTIIRIEYFDDEIEKISLVDQITTSYLKSLNSVSLYPNSHYVADENDIDNIVKQIENDLRIRLKYFKKNNQLLEYQRLDQRTQYDIESLQNLGYCPGIENYSRYLTGSEPGTPPPTLLDYFPDEFLTIIDESHLSVPQIRGMYLGDVARKSTLVKFGFRLPSALDNRPLSFDEFMQKVDKVLYVSATPGKFELEKTNNFMSEQIIRPTGLIDPEIIIRPALSQVDDLYSELKALKSGQKCFVLTLTKKMAEEISKYFADMNLRTRYMHSNIDTLEREQLLKGLRTDEFDILVGINLLREGLDVPEISLVAILDADREGFLRSRTSLIQMVGRAARNVDSKVIFYADNITNSIEEAIKETKRRRDIQKEYNKKHGIKPKTVYKKISKDLKTLYGLVSITDSEKNDKNSFYYNDKDEAKSILKGSAKAQIQKQIKMLKKKMDKASAELNFEKSIEIKKAINELEQKIND